MGDIVVPSSIERGGMVIILNPGCKAGAASPLFKTFSMEQITAGVYAQAYSYWDDYLMIKYMGQADLVADIVRRRGVYNEKGVVVEFSFTLNDITYTRLNLNADDEGADSVYFETGKL